MPNIMTLVQTVLQIHVFCSQVALLHRMLKSEKEIIQSNIYRILLKVNLVIYTLDTTCEPSIMVLAQMVLEIFCSQGSIDL